MKELAYGASHEINNPLANIAARAQTLLRDEEDDQRRRALQAIHKQAMRAHEMISDLMLFARPPALVIEKLDLRKMCSRLVAELAEECDRREIQMVCHLPDAPLTCHADAEQLAVAVKALCTNALEAIGTGGQIDISLQREQGFVSKPEPNALASDEPAKSAESTSPEASDYGSQDDSNKVLKQSQVSGISEEAFQENIIIEVADNGPGISDDVRRHMFDPFYSGREAGRGLGFGLSKCWCIVTEHGGTLVVSNHHVQGALFTICLPEKGKSHG